MTVSTDVSVILNSVHTSISVAVRHDSAKEMPALVLRASRMARAWHINHGVCETFVRNDEPHDTFASPMALAVVPNDVNADSNTLEVWEGAVLSLDHEAGVMRVLMDAKIGQLSRHSAEIDLESVSAQDRNLVRPGAVFYLTLYRRSMSSVENTLELRFRRRPPWTAAQLARVEQDATMVLSKMRELPAAS